MRLAEFDYALPPAQIAQSPVSPRDHSRLMAVSRKTGGWEHRYFYDLPEYLKQGDVLVVNATRVFPARLKGKKKTGGKVELLLIEPVTDSSNGECWRALVRGATQPTDLVFPEELDARMEKRLAEGEWVIRFSHPAIRDYLNHHGEMPLPPYIKRPVAQSSDHECYQTVYADKEGAVAAPTAGFHFTPELLQKVRDQGITVVSIVLHVGWGTFRPVRVDEIEQHAMLAERYEVDRDAALRLTQAKAEGRRIIAVGTTAVRTLETICHNQVFQAGEGQATLYIYPGYRFKAVDALITNFHLPDSTPLLLANAFYGGMNFKEPFSLKAAYQEAVEKGYRFYSYGDAMFIQ